MIHADVCRLTRSLLVGLPLVGNLCGTSSCETLRFEIGVISS
jgi:hypothetical protein